MTYTIIGRDPSSGEMGIATQSHAFAVGSSVPWSEAGIGVIASQSVGEPLYGELGLDLLRGGLAADEALVALRSVDPHPERRQVAMLDADGGIAVDTGEGCVEAAGHESGEDWCVLANLVASSRVWTSMAEAFTSTGGALGGRLVAALQAAEEEGGDLRGARSAVVSVVRSTRTGRPWQDRVLDLRVDDHRDPVREVARLMEVSDRHHRGVRAFELALDGEAEQALAHLRELGEPDREGGDLVLWHALALAMAGREEEAAGVLADAAEADPDVLEVFARYGPADLPTDTEATQRIVGRAEARLSDAGGDQD